MLQKNTRSLWEKALHKMLSLRILDLHHLQRVTPIQIRVFGSGDRFPEY